MKCPNCGYDGNEGWTSDGVWRSNLTQGYYCPRCRYYFTRTPNLDNLKALIREIVREIVEEELHRHRQEEHD